MGKRANKTCLPIYVVANKICLPFYSQVFLFMTNIIRLQYITMCAALHCLQIKSLWQLIGHSLFINQNTNTMYLIIISTR